MPVVARRPPDANWSRHENRHLEHQRRPRPASAISPIGCARAPPTSSACRRSSHVDEQFPRAEIEALGYNVETHGQKGFNGVAILSKLPFDEVTRGLPGDPDDEQARFIEGVFSTDKGALRVASLYLPNGNPVDDEKNSPTSWPGWSGWRTGPPSRLALEEPLVLAGDYNVIPEPIDARFPENWVNDALFQPQTRQAFRRLANLGFTDAVRAVTDAPRPTRSGTTRPAPGRRTTASASTI